MAAQQFWRPPSRTTTHESRTTFVTNVTLYPKSGIDSDYFPITSVKFLMITIGVF